MRTLALLFICSLIISCTSTLSYNPSYEGRVQPIPGAQLPGAAVILTTETEDNYVFAGGPTSFTGGGTNIELPLGIITKEIATNVFERMFSHGAIQAQSLELIKTPYTAVIKPKINNFSYAYNQLKNAGLLVTPQVDISLHIEIRNQEMALIHSNSFDSGTRDGDSYAFSGSPAERINRLAHEVLTDLMNQAANDVYYLLSANSSS